MQLEPQLVVLEKIELVKLQVVPSLLLPELEFLPHQIYQTLLLMSGTAPIYQIRFAGVSAPLPLAFRALPPQLLDCLDLFWSRVILNLLIPLLPPLLWMHPLR